MNPLEVEVENTDVQTPDWKQWIPVIGIYQHKRDTNMGKPIVGVQNPDMGELYERFQGCSLALIPVSGLIFLEPIVNGIHNTYQILDKII